MFKVDISSNRISAVSKKSFTELGLGERRNLQEWLANQPSALGEDLLIIQKEFDGFDDTRERLDLLALDKEGQLVIIENKLDDSGRDVVWQALKYASYCSSLTTKDIVKIYQQYLDREAATNSSERIDAVEQLCEFFVAPSLDEMKLNPGNNQRVILIAANFRKEVTSTALWLLGKGVEIQCFKVTPYSLDDQLLLNIDQIIPTPEASELMIGINAKEAEEKTADAVLKNRHRIRLDYWEQLLERFSQSSLALYSNISPSKDHWLNAGSGLRGCPYGLLLLQKELRVELSISRFDADENKQIFDMLYARKEEIESSFGGPLVWLPLENKKACRVEVTTDVDGYDKDKWSQWIEWHLNTMTRFEKALKQPLQGIAKSLRSNTTNT